MTHIHVNNVSVDLPVFQAEERRLLHPNAIKTSLGGILRRNSKNHVVVSALRNVSFDIESGQRLGLIGHNGAGKTTLLRVLTGIFTPQKGTVDIEGKIATMLNINLGLEQDATGYENIQFMLMLHGLSPTEADAAVPEIEKFSELGEFLHLPVRTYSTGMLMRLVFTVATYKQPEIVILDEIIGAGDAEFQKKVRERLNRFFEKTSIMILASHSRDIIREYCNKLAVLDHGEIIFFGEVEEGLMFYERHSLTQEAAIFKNSTNPKSKDELEKVVEEDGSVADDPLIFGLLGPWLKRNGGENKALNEIELEYQIRKSTTIQNVISNFSYVFKSTDRCELHIGIPENEIYPQLEEVEKWIKSSLDKASFSDQPHIQVTYIGDEESQNEFKNKCDVFIKKEESPSDLYNIFKQKKGDSTLTYFDLDLIVGMSDPKFVAVNHSVGKADFPSLTHDDPLNNIVKYYRDNCENIKAILDIGCGAGPLFSILSNLTDETKRRLNYVGLDLSRGQIFRAKKNYPGGVFHPGTAEDIKFQDNTFDLVVCISVLSNILPENQLKALREIFRVSSGKVFVTVFIDSRPNGLLSFNDIPYEMYALTSGKVVVPYAANPTELMREIDEKNNIQYQTFHHIYINEETGLISYSEKDTGSRRKRYDEIMNVIKNHQSERGQINIDGFMANVFEALEVTIYPGKVDLDTETSS